MHIYLWQITPLAFKHRCFKYHYTKLGRSIYIEQCIYNHLMADVYIDIEQCTYTHGRLTPLAN